MSGLKYSRVALNQARARALRQCAECENAALGVSLDLRAFREAANAEPETTEVFRQLLVELTQMLEEARKQCDQCRETVRKFWIRLDEVEAEGRKVRELVDRIVRLRERVRLAGQGLGVRTRCCAFKAVVDEQKTRLARWDRVAAETIGKEAHACVVQAENDALAGRESAVAEASLAALEERLRTLEQVVADREDRARRREMVAAALTESCAKLGYSAERETPEDPNEALLLRVNTHEYGMIDVRLELDGMVRTRSDEGFDERMARHEEREGQPCRHWVQDLTDYMNRFGLELEFRHESDDQPVRRTRDEEDLPTGEDIAAGQDELNENSDTMEAR